MKSAAFEEKEYEGALYEQLEVTDHCVWTPGQVFEQHIGIDRALLTHSRRLWKLLGRNSPEGAYLNRYRFAYAEDFRRRMPNFRLNLFIQAKRPKYFKRPPKHIRAAGLAGPGWCIDLTEHQQTALENIAATLGNRAAVVYATPAFHSLFHLYAFTRSGEIVENSNFPDVTRLRNHTKWFYTQAGGDGVANPESEFSKGPPLYTKIENMRESADARQDASPATELSILSKNVITALSQDGLEGNPRVSIFFQELRSIDEELRMLERIRTEGTANPNRERSIGEATRNYFTVAAFAKTFNIEWLVIA
jgi:hypothetical protein